MEGYFMYEKIKISPVSFVTLLKCEIVKRPNQHIKIKAEGYIDTLEDMLYTDWKKVTIQNPPYSKMKSG